MTEAWTATDNCAASPSLSVLGGPAPYWHSYTYDVTGNRISEVQHAASGDVNRSFGYPAAGGPQPHALRSVTQSGRTDTYGQDTNGNTTTRTVDGVTQNLNWDTESHLSTVVEGAKTTSYVYDADGNRLIRRDPTGATLYLGDTELRSAQTSVVGTRYYRHNDAIIAVRTGSKLSWLVNDQQGTAEVAVDAGDLAVMQRRETPFGQSRGTAPASWPGERGFVGGTNDESTGLVHLGAREYEPGTGRFVSIDPVIDHDDPQQLNGYAYGNNNPDTYSDPDGLKAKPIKAKPVKITAGKSAKSAKKSGSSSVKGKPVKVTKKSQKPDKRVSNLITKHVKKTASKLSGAIKKLADKLLKKLLDKRGGQDQYPDFEDVNVVDADDMYDFSGDTWGSPYSPPGSRGRSVPQANRPEPPAQYDPPGWSPSLPPGYQEPEPGMAAARQPGSLFTGRTHAIDPREAGSGGYLPPGSRSARRAG
jgi:RHS repeat-associated protein